MAPGRVDKRVIEADALAEEDQPEAPRDRILPAKYHFPAPDRAAFHRMFLAAHRRAEISYQGDGVWRATGEFGQDSRLPGRLVLGYIHGWRALGEELYRARAVAGLESLLREQRPDGHFPWRYHSYGATKSDDCQYITGIVGSALAKGYREFGDERYLSASRLAAEWNMALPISENNNYNMFGAWQLAELYGLTGEDRCLESAVYKTREGVLPRQMPFGGWPGHNSWIWYHGIILRGMSALYAVLPQDHPFRRDLFASMTAAINRAIRDQCENGAIPRNPGFEGEGTADGHILNGLLFARRVYGTDLDNCINGLVASTVKHLPTDSQLDELAQQWHDYRRDVEQAASAATGEVVWHAPIGGWHSDDAWGEMPVGWFNCWHPGKDTDPAHVRWHRAGEAIEFRCRGARLFGGIGCAVPKGTLTAGRRYLLRAMMRVEEQPAGLGKSRMVYASAYAGPRQPTWGPFTDCEFVRENPPFGRFEEIRVPFTAGLEDHYLYIWMDTGELGQDEAVSFIVEDVKVTDDGLPRPSWNGLFTTHDEQMALYNAGLLLDVES